MAGLADHDRGGAGDHRADHHDDNPAVAVDDDHYHDGTGDDLDDECFYQHDHSEHHDHHDCFLALPVEKEVGAVAVENMPFQTDKNRATAMMQTSYDTRSAVRETIVTTSDWTDGLPMLAGSTFTLREMRIEDAPSLLAMLTTEEVSRFISPPPTTVEGFERFIMWAARERQAGNYACFAVVPDGMTTAVGIFQVKSLDGGFTNGEWGFALGSQFWGTGIFAEGARLVVDFAVDVIGILLYRQGRYTERLWLASGGRFFWIAVTKAYVSIESC
jgi:RimJ/RimL family protein N-acetyltransferase